MSSLQNNISLELNEITEYISNLILENADSPSLSSDSRGYSFSNSLCQALKALQLIQLNIISNLVIPFIGRKCFIYNLFSFLNRHVQYLTAFFSPKKRRPCKSWISHLYYCSMSDSIVRALVPRAEARRKSVPMIRYNCKGEMTIKEYPDGSFLVLGKHALIHPRKMETTVPEKVLEYIRQNLTKSSGEIYSDLAKWKEMENVTQKQIYYHWNKLMASSYRRSTDQIESTVALINELNGVELLYFDDSRPKSIAVLTKVGIKLMSLQSPVEIFIDSTCNTFSFHLSIIIDYKLF